jgi:PAS domain S-box-containing protein
MDTTTEGTMQARAWELLAALAATRPAGERTNQMAKRIAELFQVYLANPWGLILLQAAGEPDAADHWGLDAEAALVLAVRNGHPLPDACIEIALTCDGVPAGTILLGTNEELHGTLVPGLLAAVRGQLDMQLALAARELALRTPTAPPATAPEASAQTRLQQLKAIQRISRQLTATLYLHTILGFALKESLRATNASHGYIALRGYAVQREGYDLEQEEAQSVTPSPQVYIALDPVEESGPIRIIAAAGYNEDEQQQLLNLAISGGTTVAELVMQSGEPIAKNDLHDDDRPRTIGPLAASVVVAPIYYEDQVIGVVNLHSSTSATFDRDSLEFTRVVADQIALAIWNRDRYYEQRRQRDLLQQRANTLNQVLRIGQDLRADRSLDDVLEQIAFSVAETASFRVVVFYLVEEDTQQLRLIAGGGLPLSDLSRLRGTPLALGAAQQLLDPRFQIGRGTIVPAAEAQAHGLNLRLEDVEGDDALRSEHEWQAGDLVVVPLHSTHGQLVGLMVADEPYDRQAPSRRSIEPLEIFANQAAITIENARLLREARSQAEQMTALFRVSTAAVSTLNLDDLLERAYDEITAYLGTPSFLFVASYQARSNQLRFELFKREGRTHERFHKTTRTRAGLVGWVIEHGEMLSIADTERETLPVEPVLLVDMVRSWVGIPLRSQNTVIGVLSVQSFEPNAFSDRDLRFLTTVANQLAVAMESARLFEERERRISELAVINRIGHISSSTLNVEQLLGQVYECLAAFLPLDAFYGVVYHADRNELAGGLTVDEGVHAAWRDIGPPRPGGVTERIIQQRQPLLFANIAAEYQGAGLRLTHFGDSSRASASWLGVPLIVSESEVVGVLSVQSYAPDMYGERELSFLTTVASQVALGVQNARLFGERERQIVELDALGRIGRVTSSTLELRPMVEGLALVLREVLDAESISLTLIGRDRGLERLLVIDRDRTVTDTSNEPVYERVGETLAGWIARHSRPLRIGDLSEVSPPFTDARLLFANGDSGRARSYLGIPILSHDGTPAGALGVASRRLQAFSSRDEGFLTSVGAQMSLGVQNTHLYAEAQGSATALQRKVGELSTLLKAAGVLSSSLKPNTVLDTLMEVVGEQLMVNTVALWKITEGDMLVPTAMAGIPPDVAQTLRVPIGSGLTGRVAATGQSLVVEDVERDGSSLYPSFNRQNQYTSFMGVPVVYRDETIGVLSVMTVQRRVFSSDDVQLLSGLAVQAAIALENARLFDGRESQIVQLSTLNRISQAINATLDLDELLLALLSEIGDVVDTSESFIALYDASTRWVTFPLVLSNGQRSAKHESESYMVEDGNGLTDRVIFERRPLLLRTQPEVDAISPVPTPEGEPPICSWLGVPIIKGDEVLGVLNVQSYRPAAFNTDDLRFLTTVANQAAIALNNARLFQSELNRRRIADTLREVALILTGVLQLDEIITIILHQLARVIPYDTASLMLREGDELQMASARGFAPSIRAVVEQMRFGVDDDPHLRQVVRTRRPLAVADLRANPLPSTAPTEGTEQIRSWIGAPLLLNDEVIGVLNVDNFTPGAYDDEDAQLAFALASQAAQAIRNARLFTEVRRFNAELERLVEARTADWVHANTQLLAEKERLQAVHNITLELTASLELEKTLNRALGLAAIAVGAKRGSIMLRDTQSGVLTCRAVLLSDGSVATTNIPISFASGGGLSGWVMKHQEPTCIADVRSDRRWLVEEGRADEVRSVIVAPLMTQDGPLGVLMLSSPQINFFSQEQVQLLATIANEVAIVIHNATLYTVINEIAMERGELWAQQREENSKNQAILQSLGEGVMVLDEHMRLVLYNTAAEQMLGIPARELEGQPITRLLTTSGPAAHQAQVIFDGLIQGLRALAEQNRSHNRMLEIPGPDKMIALNFAPWVDPRGKVYGNVVVLRDITREIEADRAKRNFISSVSHELRTPLTSIKGYVDLLLLNAAGPLNDGQVSFLGVVKNNANRLMDLINDILEIGRIDENKILLSFEPLEIAHVLSDVIQTLRAEIERKSLDVSVAVTSDVPTIIADPRRITQVLLNMLSNAVKYTYSGGQVLVRASLNPAGLLQVDVEDNGVGISPEQQQHLFRRFYRADNPLRDEAGGTGLGLSIAKSLVELHGGEMWVESDVGKGSTFSFIIPVTQPEQRDETDAAA